MVFLCSGLGRCVLDLGFCLRVVFTGSWFDFVSVAIRLTWWVCFVVLCYKFAYCL